MGQAKARGTFEQRKAEAVERDKVLAAKRTEEHRALMVRQAKERHERLSKLEPKARKEVMLMEASPKHTSLMLAAALALAASSGRGLK